MKSAFLLITGWFCFVATASGQLRKAVEKRPNVIVILADDLGWTDLACYGSSFYETPNLDKLAAAGSRFIQNYATSPVCSPTRSSILTGRYPIKTGVTDWIRGRQEDGKAMPYEKLIANPTAYQLALEEKTIAEMATEDGYRTLFAGKWHLGEEEKFWPQFQGFQTNKGGWSKGSPTGRINDSTGGFFTPYQNPTLMDGPEGEYLTDRLTDESIQFIEANKQGPFLLFYSLYAVHNPLQAPKPLIAKYLAKQRALGIQAKDRFAKDEAWMKHEEGWKRRTVQDQPIYAAMIENMDWNIGRLLAKLRESGLDNNTLVIFTSDNGGLSTAEGSPTTNAPLRAGKGWLYEGGIRVPMIISWKGNISPGTVTDLPVNSTDIFPTIANAIRPGYPKDKGVDGDDLLTLLSKPSWYDDRPLFFYYPHYSNQGGKPGAAIRQGDFKLIYNYEDESVELYNLRTDIGEKNDLAAIEKQTAQRLKQKLFQWLATNGAKNLNKNPGYTADAKPAQKVQDH